MNLNNSLQRIFAIEPTVPTHRTQVVYLDLTESLAIFISGRLAELQDKHDLIISGFEVGTNYTIISSTSKRQSYDVKFTYYMNPTSVKLINQLQEDLLKEGTEK